MFRCLKFDPGPRTQDPGPRAASAFKHWDVCNDLFGNYLWGVAGCFVTWASRGGRVSSYRLCNAWCWCCKLPHFVCTIYFFHMLTRHTCPVRSTCFGHTLLRQDRHRDAWKITILHTCLLKQRQGRRHNEGKQNDDIDDHSEDNLHNPDNYNHWTTTI